MGPDPGLWRTKCTMQVWTMRMFAGSGATGARFDTAPAPVPALAAIAAITPAGATRTGTQITYAPVTHLPSPTCPRCTSSAGSM